MEDYIFIILAIALSIVGAIGRNKNKRVPANTNFGENQPPRRTNVFDQFLNETFFEEQPVVKPVNTPVQNPVQMVQKQKREKRSPKPFLTNESTERRTKRITSTLKKAESIKKEVPDKKNRYIHELMKDFSPRKAIIYSEIINRKY